MPTPIPSPVGRAVAPLLVGVVVALTLAACSGSTDSGSTTTTRAADHQGGSSACSLVTPAQIESALGRKVLAPTATNSTGSTACTYRAVNGRKNDAVIIAFRSNVTAAQAGAEQAALEKQHGTLSPVSVTGAQAFSFTTMSGSDTITSLVTLVGESQLSITSTASLDRTETLAQEIFTNLSDGASSTSTTAPAG